MTEQEWKEVEEKLKSLFEYAKLKCDEYVVTLHLVRVDQFKNAIAVYVNGEFRGKWLMEDCEERRRFCRPITRSLHSQKQKKDFQKLSKRHQKILRESGIDIDKKVTYYASHWTSFRSLKSHLIKNNKVIELLRSEC